MNGPEHYAEAERLLRDASTPAGTPCEDETSAAFRAAAQVHATLALAAASALPAVAAYIGDERVVGRAARVGERHLPAGPGRVMTATTDRHAIRDRRTTAGRFVKSPDEVFGPYPSHDDRRTWLLEFAESVAIEDGRNREQPSTAMVPALVPFVAAQNCPDPLYCFTQLVGAVKERSRFVSRTGPSGDDVTYDAEDERTQSDVDYWLDALMARDLEARRP